MPHAKARSREEGREPVDRKPAPSDDKNIRGKNIRKTPTWIWRCQSPFEPYFFASNIFVVTPRPSPIFCHPFFCRPGPLRGFGYTVTIAVSNRVKGIDDGNCLLNIKLRPGVRRRRSTRNGAVWTTQAKGNETPDDESASPNPERGKAPSGLVTQISAASLPKMVKPKPAGKKQDKSTCRAGRGRGASAY
jgi:hypothetical protein